MTRRLSPSLVAGLALCVSASAALAQHSGLPFKGEDFADAERVYWGRKIHSESGVQRWGYDLGAARYDQGAGKWKEAKGSAEKNSDWYVYGKPVYAMRDGKVIACWRNAPENPRTGVGAGKWHPELTKYRGGGSRIYGGGNGFWIEHDDGSRAEYAHFQPGTVPGALCPHNAPLLPEVISSPSVTDAWEFIRVPPEEQKTVKAGQLLGRVGNSGTSSAPHLHVHVESGGVAGATKSGGSPVQVSFRSGLYVDCSDNSFQNMSCGAGPFGTWKRFAGKPIPSGPVLIWPSRTLGREYARHGYPAERYSALFQHLADSGYRPVWIDAYGVAGRHFLNHVWRPSEGAWRAYHLLTPAKYQEVFDQATKARGGRYAPVFVESSVLGGQPRYSVIFVRNQPGGAIARHGISHAEHMDEMERAKKQGLVPVNVSVASLGGKRLYTVLYRSGNIGTWEMKSEIPEGSYQQEYDTQSKAGRKPLYLSAYMHQGKPYISAIFGQVSTTGRKDRHGMTGAAYQSEYASAHAAGMLTRCVTGVDGEPLRHRYAACWWK